MMSSLASVAKSPSIEVGLAWIFARWLHRKRELSDGEPNESGTVLESVGSSLQLDDLLVFLIQPDRDHGRY
jgi:hypothetical protein